MKENLVEIVLWQQNGKYSLRTDARGIRQKKSPLMKCLEMIENGLK